MSGFGERIIAQAGGEDEIAAASTRPPILPWFKLVVLAIIAALLVGGVIHLGSRLSNWFQRQDLIEQLKPTDYDQKFLDASPLADSDVKAPPATAASEVDVTEGIEKASAAIQSGDAAREEERFADAVNLYLHALNLEPASSEARTQLWKTLETWSKTDAPVGRINAGKLEQAAQYAPQAAWLLSEYYLRRDPALGLHWLKKSADDGHPSDMRKLGMILIQGKLAPANPTEGMRWLKRAADKGDPESQFYYGECLIFGEFIKKDVFQGTDYLEMASSLENAEAKELLGVCMIEKIGSNKNESEAFKLLSESAELGNASANLQLGLCHLHGNGTPKDQSAAAAAFKKGAELGDSSAMWTYALCLESGLGVPASQKSATDWMKKAATAGHAEAQAWCSDHGIEYE